MWSDIFWKLLAVVTLIAVLLGVKFGLVSLGDYMGPDFITGTLFGWISAGLLVWFCLWLDKDTARRAAERD